LPRSDCRQRARNYPINRVAAFDRNRWPLWIGLGGRLPSESLAALPRNPQAMLTRADEAANNHAISASHAGMKRTCRQVRYSVANGGKAAADSRKPKASGGRLLCTAASCAMLVPMARFLPVLKHRRCPTCRSLYEYSERPNSLGLAAPTECFCSVCGDLVAAWSDDQIRVYIFVASEEQVHQAQNSQLRT